MSFKILIQVKGVDMCSIAKFLKTTKEMFFLFVAYWQDLMSVVAGWEYQSNELRKGRWNGNLVFIKLWFPHFVMEHIFSKSFLPGMYRKSLRLKILGKSLLFWKSVYWRFLSAGSAAKEIAVTSIADHQSAVYLSRKNQWITYLVC